MVRVMANRRVAIYQSAKINGRWSYYRPVIGKNNKIKPDWCHVNGHKECHPGSDYIIRWYEGSKPRIRGCKSAADAANQAEIQRGFLNAKALGVPVKEPEVPSLFLSSAIYAYLEEYQLTHRPNTYVQAKGTLEEFLTYCKRTNVGDVTKMDLLKYAEWLQRYRGRSARTAANKFLRVHQFFKSKGIKLVTGKDAPKFVEPLPEVYSLAEQEKFLAKCNANQTLIFSVFLKAGLREREMMYLQWGDINLEEGTLRVRAKPEFGWVPKTWEEREIPIPDDLVLLLKPHAKKSNVLCFPTKNNKPSTKLLRTCKRIAAAAELTCGVCDGCKSESEDAGCERWYLHKFRATYATSCLRAGVDIKTVQTLLGHKDIESTMRYLAPATNATIKEQLNDVWKKKPSAFVHLTCLPDGTLAVSGEPVAGTMTVNAVGRK